MSVQRRCITQMMCCLQVRDQLTHLEDNVPWNAVKSAWRNRRPGWRRQLKAADSIAEVATRMEEFRQHLANDGPSLVVQLPKDLNTNARRTSIRKLLCHII